MFGERKQNRCIPMSTKHRDAGECHNKKEGKKKENVHLELYYPKLLSLTQIVN